MKKDIESLNVVVLLAGTVAITLAIIVVLFIYSYMDHTNSVVSLALGSHTSKCIHQACTLSKHPR